MFVSDSYSVALSASLSVKLHSTLCTKLLTPVSAVPVSCQHCASQLSALCQSAVSFSSLHYLLVALHMCRCGWLVRLSCVVYSLSLSCRLSLSQWQCVCL